MNLIPQNLEGLSGNGFIRLQWDPVTGATGYKIKYGTITNNYTTETDIGSGYNISGQIEWKIIGLTNEQNYFIRVCAYDGGGDGAYSTEISRYVSNVLDLVNFRTQNLVGYLPIDDIIGNLPFKVPEIETGINEILDFSYQLESNEIDVLQKTLNRSQDKSYDLLQFSEDENNSIQSVIGEDGIKYEHITDYTISDNKIFWQGTHVPEVGKKYIVNYISYVVDTLIRRDQSTYEYDILTTDNAMQVNEVRDETGAIYIYMEHYQFLRNRIYWLPDVNITTPTGSTITVLQGSGNLPASTYYYVISAYRVSNVSGDVKKETLQTAQLIATVTGTNNSVILGWDTVDFSDGYRVYRSVIPGVYTDTLIKDINDRTINTFTDNRVSQSAFTPATVNETTIQPATGRAYNVTYVVGATVSVNNQSKLTELSNTSLGYTDMIYPPSTTIYRDYLFGSVMQQIRDINFVSSEDTGNYIKLHALDSNIKMEVYPTLVSLTTGCVAYAHADIEDGLGFWSVGAENFLAENNPSFETDGPDFVSTWNKPVVANGRQVVMYPDYAYASSIVGKTFSCTIDGGLTQTVTISLTVLQDVVDWFTINLVGCNVTSYYNGTQGGYGIKLLSPTLNGGNIVIGSGTANSELGLTGGEQFSNTTDNLQIDTDSKYGDYCLQQTLSVTVTLGVGQYTGRTTYFTNANYIAVDSGSTYVLSAYVRTPSVSVTVYGQLLTRQFDNVGNELTTDIIYYGNPTIDWVRQSHSFITLPTTESIKVECYIGGSMGASVYWDAIQLENNSYLTQYTDTFTNDNVINANIIRDSDSVIIGDVSIKCIPLTATVTIVGMYMLKETTCNVYEYTPHPSELINYERGNVVNSFEVDYQSQYEGKDRLIYYRTRVLSPRFETNWSDIGVLTIPQNRHLEVVNRMVGKLPDENTYNKEIVKLDSSEKSNYNVYNVLDVYGEEFGKQYYEIQRVRDSISMDYSRDSVFESNFGSFWGLNRIVGIQMVDYRYIVKQVSIASTEGSTISAIKRICMAFTGANPNINLIRDSDWWILNGNLIHNPSFEFDSNYFGSIPFWNLSSNVVSERSTEQFKWGVSSLKQVVFNDASPASYDTFSDYMPINKDATQISVSGYCYNPGVSDVIAGLDITLYDKNFNVLVNDGTNITVISGYWQRISFTKLVTPYSGVAVKMKVGLKFLGGVGTTVYWDGIQAEEGPLTPYEDFEYYLDDPSYPEIEPPILWDKNEYAHAVVIQIRNPYGFILDEDYITNVLEQFYPAHVKVYLEILSVNDSFAYMIWDVSHFDTRYWY